MTILRKVIDRIVNEPDFFVNVRIASYVITFVILLVVIL